MSNEDILELGKQTWHFVFSDGTMPEEHTWYIIMRLDNGHMCPMVKKPGEIWEIPGEQLWLQLGLLENNLVGSAFASDATFFGNKGFVEQNPSMDWVKVIDYQPILAEEYSPEQHRTWQSEIEACSGDQSQKAFFPKTAKSPVSTSVLAKVESPIEESFLQAAHRAGLKLTPQVVIGEYRADFQVEDTRILIELDGHTYHASRRARRNDALRDRRLTKKGFTVIRFTSDEIFEDVDHCVRQVIELKTNLS